MTNKPLNTNTAFCEGFFSYQKGKEFLLHHFDIYKIFGCEE